jgi:hypothetical protein
MREESKENLLKVKEVVYPKECCKEGALFEDYESLYEYYSHIPGNNCWKKAFSQALKGGLGSMFQMLNLKTLGRNWCLRLR